MEGTMIHIYHRDPTDPFKVTIEKIPFVNDLKTLQRLCGGYIDALPQQWYFPYIDIPYLIGWCDDEGKLKQKDVTLPVFDPTGKVVDVLVGDIVLTGHAGEDTIGLTEDESEEVIDSLLSIYSGTRYEVQVPSRVPVNLTGTD